MSQLINATVKKMFHQLGFDIRRIKQIPFGVDYVADIKYCLNGKTLDIVFDVGANIGQTSLHIAKYFPNSQIYSFEPLPDTCQQLVNHTKDFKNIQVINKALSNFVGESSMIPSSNSLLTSLCSEEEKNLSLSLKVPVDTVDNFCLANDISRISLLKTDTEGFDLKVIKGSEKLLKNQNIDYIYTECRFFNRRIPSDFIEMIYYLKDNEYSLVTIYTEAVDDLGFVFGNALFRSVNQEQASRFSWSPFGMPVDWSQKTS